MYYTGIDPFSKQEVYVARNLRDRKLQRALLQFFKPDNYFEVRKALEQAGRADLIGGGCGALIPAHPPMEAIEARRKQANEAAGVDHYHSVANPARGRRLGSEAISPTVLIWIGNPAASRASRPTDGLIAAYNKTAGYGVLFDETVIKVWMGEKK
jgi:hypothetical protein